MAVAIFESQDMPIQTGCKMMDDGLWFNFTWEPSLSINGQTCMSATAGVFWDERGDTIEIGSKDDLVENIRLASLKESHDHYAAIDDGK